MSDMKCPFCNSKLSDVSLDYDWKCEKCSLAADLEVWQELIRTRKALETIKKEFHKETMPDFAVIRDALKGVGDE